MEIDWNTLIVAGTSLLGTVAGSYSGMKLMSFRLERLEDSVKEHNNFARRMPVVEEQIKVINHRLSDLERDDT